MRRKDEKERERRRGIPALFPRSANILIDFLTEPEHQKNRIKEIFKHPPPPSPPPLFFRGNHLFSSVLPHVKRTGIQEEVLFILRYLWRKNGKVN
jgi:hypothetical protein